MWSQLIGGSVTTATIGNHHGRAPSRQLYETFDVMGRRPSENERNSGVELFEGRELLRG